MWTCYVTDVTDVPAAAVASGARRGTWRPRDYPNAIGITSPAGGTTGDEETYEPN